jgi:hypothetical protein
MGQSNRIYQKGDRVTQRKFREQNLRDTWWRLVGMIFLLNVKGTPDQLLSPSFSPGAGTKENVTEEGGRLKDRQQKIDKKRSATKLSPQS